VRIKFGSRSLKRRHHVGYRDVYSMALGETRREDMDLTVLSHDMGSGEVFLTRQYNSRLRWQDERLSASIHEVGQWRLTCFVHDAQSTAHEVTGSRRFDIGVLQLVHY